jgi:hypothetical protein
MQGKFVYGGEGAKVPGTGFGLSVSLFKLWLCSTGGAFRGYTTASNEGLLGYAIIETPIVDFTMPDPSDESPFTGLHGSTVDVAITPTIFVKDGGIATIRLVRRSNDGSPNPQLTFFSDACKGVSASVGDIAFTATLLELPAEEQDPTGVTYVPW